MGRIQKLLEDNFNNLPGTKNTTYPENNDLVGKIKKIVGHVPTGNHDDLVAKVKSELPDCPEQDIRIALNRLEYSEEPGRISHVIGGV